MNFTTEYPEPNISSVHIQGEIDLYSSSALRTEFTRLIDQGYTRLILDAEKLEYMDSSGVGVLIHLLQKLKARNGRLAVCRLNGSPLRVLEMSNIISLLDVYSNMKEAITALKQKEGVL